MEVKPPSISDNILTRGLSLYGRLGQLHLYVGGILQGAFQPDKLEYDNSPPQFASPYRQLRLGLRRASLGLEECLPGAGWLPE